MKPIRIFIGYDKDINSIAHVCTSSILRRSTIPISFTYISRKMLSGVLTKPKGENDSTEFSISRFLTPYLSDYKGMSIFMDNDVIRKSEI